MPSGALTIYDAAGRLVRRLSDAPRGGGLVAWRTIRFRGAGTGRMYLVRLQT